MGEKRTTGQLTLDVRRRLAYRPDNFLLHSGVVSVLDITAAALRRPGFTLIFVEGAPRSGKTHFSIRLAADLSGEALFPRLLDGADMKQWLEERWPDRAASAAEVYIVDDAHHYMNGLSPENAGGFVNFIETLRVGGGKVVFLSAAPAASFPWDGHVRSRVDSGTQLCLAPPDDSEVGELVQRMARQRGIRFSDRKLQFLLKRVGRDIGAIERYLSRVDQLSEVTGSNIDLALLGDALE